ncbi:MAG: LacI family transcriptional regulator [Synergistaceae bacterium]|nr:LacI family DNA-binding transcriptional regulator [Aminivibrio sp.]MDK2959324.1 LacI family transcriptional regulator [Synergistaceae bacterium]
MVRGSNLRDVAQRAGVSVMTVSRFINQSGYVNRETSRRISQAIKELQYRPNQIAKSLQTMKTGNIAVLLGNVSSPMSSLTIKGIENISFQKGYNLLICNTDFSEEKEQKYLDILMQKQIDGMILAPCSNRSEPLQEVLDRGIPLLFLDRRVPGISADYVGFDFENDSFRLTSHLVDAGCRKIAIICRKADIVYESPQLKGYTRALQASSIPVDEKYVQYCHSSPQKGYEAMEEITGRCRPDAVYATSSVLAAGVLRFCRDRKIRIPGDCLVASFDSFGEYDDLIRPNLTCNEVPAFALGVSGAELLTDRISGGAAGMGPRHVVFPGKLLLRESTCRG